MIGFVLEEDIQKCKYWVERCLELGERFDYENLYPKEYLRAIGFLLCFNGHLLKKSLFDEMNNWFGLFANGILEYDMSEKNPIEYNQLMNFTTQFCFTIANYNKEEYFLRLKIKS